MNEDFEKLQLLGAQKIYEQTHITRVNVEHILSKSFDQLDKVKFYGFLSILEREYSLNLEPLKQEYDAYLEAHYEDEDDLSEMTYEIQIKKKKRLQKIMLAVIVLIGVVSFIYLLFARLEKKTEQPLIINNTQIDKAAKLIDNNNTKAVADLNSTNSLNTPQESNITAAPTVQKKSEATKLEFITTAKLWMGITDLGTGKQTQKVVQNSFELNATKDYLLILGHGMIRIDLGDKNITLPQRGKVWLLFKNGALKTLTHDQYKQLNKGKSW
jgi:phosphate starvation-inducible protein PhoH